MKPRFLSSIATQLRSLWQGSAKDPPPSERLIGVGKLKRNAAKPRKRRSRLPVFVAEAQFLRELIKVLTIDANEQMHFLTGPRLESFRVICRWAHPVALQQQSPVFVRASAKAVADLLIGLIEQGAELHVIAHSHPGIGPGATTPSGTDLTCLGKLQKSGSPAIGCIVTRDNHIRFFTVSKPFRVIVQGTGVTQLDHHVFFIAP